MPSCFSHVQLFATLWTIAHSSSLHGILQARILEWVAMPLSGWARQWKNLTLQVMNACEQGYIQVCGTSFLFNLMDCLWQYGIIIVVQSLSSVRLFVTPWTAARQATLSFTISWSLLKLMPIELVMPSNHCITYHPLLLCPQSFPASGSFLMSQLFARGGQSIGTSALASVLLTNIQDWLLSRNHSSH